MPYPGSLIEQPGGVMLRFEKILDAMGDIEETEHKHWEAKNKQEPE